MSEITEELYELGVDLRKDVIDSYPKFKSAMISIARDEVAKQLNTNPKLQWTSVRDAVDKRINTALTVLPFDLGSLLKSTIDNDVNAAVQEVYNDLVAMLTDPPVKEDEPKN